MNKNVVLKSYINWFLVINGVLFVLSFLISFISPKILFYDDIIVVLRYGDIFSWFKGVVLFIYTNWIVLVGIISSAAGFAYSLLGHRNSKLPDKVKNTQAILSILNIPVFFILNFIDGILFYIVYFGAYIGWMLGVSLK